ncbi:MAG: hypothetical protein GVY26_01420 [Bacteroidetes bacterium]|jgi:hypothetical protein|nr:hypothetical protein [Bacteroidota bacterium]
MEYLIKEDFILINKATIDRHGGNYSPPLNLLNAESVLLVPYYSNLQWNSHQEKLTLIVAVSGLAQT